MRLTDWRIPRILLPVAAGVLLALLLAACGGGGGDGPNGNDEDGAIKNLEYAGPVPWSDNSFLRLLSPHTRSVIRVKHGPVYNDLCCETTVDGRESVEMSLEQVLGVEWTGTLSTIFDDPAVPEYEYGITVIDAVDNMLFLGVDADTREPWENVLRKQAYERSQVKDAALWIGPPPWEAFAFMGHGLIVSNTESNMTELLERRITGGASFYDVAGDLWESLPSGAVQSLEQTSGGIIRGVSVRGFFPDVEVIRLVDYMGDEQAELDIQKTMGEWRYSSFISSCSEPVNNLEGLRYSFETVCPADLVLDDLFGS